MSDFLTTVVRERRAYVAASRATRPLAQVESAARRAAFGRGTVSLAAEIRRRRETGRLAVIAEVKRISPALGPLATGLDPAALAQRYQEAGAAAISVLVEPHHWGGSLDDLRAVEPAVRRLGWPTGEKEPAYGILPVLAKDVIVDEYQIAEAGAAGAHAVLLIAEALSDLELHRLILYARSLGMDALVEAHDPAAFDLAVRVEEATRNVEIPDGLALGRETLLGVNARDLREPSRLDRGTIHRLAPLAPRDPLLVAESGVTSVEDAEALPMRVDAVLVGTALVRAADPAPLVRALAAARPGRALA
ncbi:MAG TPA: indole-3-glycerol phosphate synthase TrpC [Candidatus Limnocylindrales bacterium]|nr:indole-3-glycerol phosphate synthase TrpC [Candidatus Limnocylindrales bacterium]